MVEIVHCVKKTLAFPSLHPSLQKTLVSLCFPSSSDLLATAGPHLRRCPRRQISSFFMLYFVLRKKPCIIEDCPSFLLQHRHHLVSHRRPILLRRGLYFALYFVPRFLQSSQVNHNHQIRPSKTLISPLHHSLQ